MKEPCTNVSHTLWDMQGKADDRLLGTYLQLGKRKPKPRKRPGEKEKLDARPGLLNLLPNILLIQRKRTHKHARELLHLPLKRVRVLPRQPRVQQLARDALDLGRDLQVERAKVLVLGLEELARVDRVDDAPREPERAALEREVKKLASMFVRAFALYEKDVVEKVKEAGPRV